MIKIVWIRMQKQPWFAAAVLMALLLAGVGIGTLAGRALKPGAEPVPTPVHVGDDRNGPELVVPEQPAVEPPPEAVLAPSNPQIAVATPLPEANPASKPAWKRYAVPFKAIADKPKIAIVIDDLGIDRRRSLIAIELPPPLTLAFMTYADDLADQTEKARRRGHELLVHMPMQAMSAHFNAGPNVLEVGLSDRELRQRIDWGLDRFSGYVGVNNHMGSRFTADIQGMEVVMSELKRHGLLFLDSVTTDGSQAGAAAKRLGVPFLQRQVFLDNDQSVQAIREQLIKTEEIAKRHGQAIAIGHPHDATLAALADWLPTLAAKGFEIVPLTALLIKEK